MVHSWLVRRPSWENGSIFILNGTLQSAQGHSGKSKCAADAEVRAAGTWELRAEAPAPFREFFSAGRRGRLSGRTPSSFFAQHWAREGAPPQNSFPHDFFSLFFSVLVFKTPLHTLYELLNSFFEFRRLCVCPSTMGDPPLVMIVLFLSFSLAVKPEVCGMRAAAGAGLGSLPECTRPRSELARWSRGPAAPPCARREGRGCCVE